MLSASKKLNTKTGVYIELECTKQSKRDLRDYVRTHIDPNSEYNDFHITLIYSKKPFKGTININIDVKNKIKSKFNSFVRFDNPDEDIYAVAIKLDCKLCEKIHKDLMKKYDFVYDYSEYIPHITLTYKGKDVDISKLPEYNKTIDFDKINIEPLNEDWANDVE